MKPIIISRKISRRLFLKTSALAATGMALAGCATANRQAPPSMPVRTVAQLTSEPKPPPTIIPTPAGISTKGDTGNIVVVYRADTNDSFKTVVDKFTKETGIGVTHEIAPDDYMTWQQYMTTRLASG